MQKFVAPEDRGLQQTLWPKTHSKRARHVREALADVVRARSDDVVIDLPLLY